MEPPVFYAPPENIDDNKILLPGAESHHLARVLRLKPPAIVIVADGLGMAYRTEVFSIGHSRVTVRVHSRMRNFGEPAVRLTLAAGLSAGSKFDALVQKGTEVGVKRFVPIISDKSKVPLTDPRRMRNKLARLESVALAAMKQCRRAYRPDISSPISLKDFLTETDAGSLNLIFHPSPDAKPLSDLQPDPSPQRVSVLIGPESGFSENELDLAAASGYEPVALGPRVLRTETAGPIVCALLMERLGEFR
jgi:16S rRNA (uracil1498-N3)-methyltransferase